MSRYTNHNLNQVHDIHYSWTGWPSSESSIPTATPELLDGLTSDFKSDGLLMESYAWKPDSVQLTVAAQPKHSPVWISQRLKGRLDYALRKQGTQVSFVRKVSLRAIGHNRTGVVDRYVRDQLKHVDLADPRYRATLADAAIHNREVDLAQPAESSHGRYWYNLHLVFVVIDRYRIGGHGFLNKLREQVLTIAENQDCSLKRAAIMPDHMHIALRGNPKLSPEEIALNLQNATAQAAGCLLWQHQFYVGTFGEYDKGAV